jgi:hypothetical protein
MKGKFEGLLHINSSILPFPFLTTMSFTTPSGPVAFGGRRPLSTAANPRPSAIVGLSQDPWAPYQLCPGASDTDKAAYALLRAEITEKDALSSVKELAEQKWWNQQNALTYDADRNSRLLSLLRAAIPHHKATQDAAVINFRLDRLLALLADPRPNPRAGPLPQPRGGLSAEERATFDALKRIKCDHTLVTPKMLEEAHVFFNAHVASELQKKKEDAARKSREAEAAAAAASLQLNTIRANGWA